MVGFVGWRTTGITRFVARRAALPLKVYPLASPRYTCPVDDLNLC
jgi:hypothetical protein